MDNRTISFVIDQLAGDNSADRIEQVARYFAYTLHVGGLAECRRLIVEAIDVHNVAENLDPNS